MNDHIKPEISAYLAGGLPESRNRQIEAHAAACEKCRNALSKARAKQARLKREALKSAEPERVPNLFLARQGKREFVTAQSAGKLKILGVILLIGGVGYWLYSRPASTTAVPLETETSTAHPAQSPPPSVPKVQAPAVVKDAEPPKPPLVLPVLENWQGADSGIKEIRLMVIRNTEALQKVWTEMQQNDPLPNVEFNQKLVLAVFGGPRPPETTITLGKIQEVEGTVYAPYRISQSAVVVSSTTPPTPGSLSHPYLLVVVPRVDKKIRLTQREDLP